MVIIDTNILIEISRENDFIRQKCKEIGFENMVITPIIFAEFYVGIHNKESEKKALTIVEKFTILPFNQEIGTIFKK